MESSNININIGPAIENFVQDTVRGFNKEALLWFGKIVKPLADNLKNKGPLVVAIGILAMAVIGLAGLSFGLYIQLKKVSHDAKLEMQEALDRVKKYKALEDDITATNAELIKKHEGLETEKKTLAASLAILQKDRTAAEEQLKQESKDQKQRFGCIIDQKQTTIHSLSTEKNSLFDEKKQLEEANIKLVDDNIKLKALNTSLSTEKDDLVAENEQLKQAAAAPNTRMPVEQTADQETIKKLQQEIEGLKTQLKLKEQPVQPETDDLGWLASFLS